MSLSVGINATQEPPLQALLAYSLSFMCVIGMWGATEIAGARRAGNVEVSGISSK